MRGYTSLMLDGMMVTTALDSKVTSQMVTTARWYDGHYSMYKLSVCLLKG